MANILVCVQKIFCFLTNCGFSDILILLLYRFYCKWIRGHEVNQLRPQQTWAYCPIIKDTGVRIKKEMYFRSVSQL